MTISGDLICFENQEHEKKHDFTDKIEPIEPYDIAVVGGGMVGMALVCSLGR